MRPFEKKLIHFLSAICIPLARISFFVVYFYFGLLKILGYSPAEILVQELWSHTMSFMPFHTFILIFGLLEMAIGLIFLIPGWERLALYILIPHMITTFGPLVILPEFCWKGFMVPTLAGHYIIKNLMLIALAIFIVAHIGDFRSRRQLQATAK